MINFNNALDVIYEDNGILTSFKLKAVDFLRDTFEATFIAGEDFLYIGYYKPIHSIYFDIATPNTNTGTLSVGYYNGSGWTAPKNAYDETMGLTRSGFIYWDVNQKDEDETGYNSKVQYWYRVAATSSTSAVTFNGINILFSSDAFLKTKFDKITSPSFLDGQASHINTHVAVRDEIVEEFRRKGYITLNTQDENADTLKSLSPWDMLDIFEVREAAAYLALHKIFFNFSDDPDDIYMEKSMKYEDRYKQCMNLAFLSIDINDNGKKETSEDSRPSTTKYITR